MRSEGAQAPAVSLPAYVDGERREIDLADYIDEGVVVLAFYPADFNPACTTRASDLDDLDLFTMDKDVTVFGVSPDSTYSHEAFAERYGLHVPLLSDREGEAAAAYGVGQTTDHGEALAQRAVFVIDHRATIQYAWATDDLTAGFDVTPVRQAVGDIGGDDIAVERYRVGHDHYAAGREAFTEAMAAYEDREWTDAGSGFETAEPEFTAAAAHFDTAVRFAETDDFETVVDRAEGKADTLSHAASWLADSADALASGRGKRGSQYREDAQRLLDAAADRPEPPGSDAFALTDDGVELGDSAAVDAVKDEGYAWRGDDPNAADTGLDIDDEALDAAVEGADGEATDDAEPGAEGDTAGGDLEMDLDAAQEAAADGPANEAAEAGTAESARPDPSGGDAGAPAEDGGQLDLVDPTEDRDQDETDDERADRDVPGR